MILRVYFKATIRQAGDENAFEIGEELIAGLLICLYFDQYLKFSDRFFFSN